MVADSEERRATWTRRYKAEQRLGVVNRGAIQQRRENLSEGPHGADQHCARDPHPHLSEPLSSPRRRRRLGPPHHLPPQSDSVASHRVVVVVAVASKKQTEAPLLRLTFLPSFFLPPFGLSIQAATRLPVLLTLCLICSSYRLFLSPFDFFVVAWRIRLSPGFQLGRRYVYWANI